MVYPDSINVYIARWVIWPPYQHLDHRMVLLPPVDGLLRLLLQLPQLFLLGPQQQALEIHSSRQNQVRELHSVIHLNYDCRMMVSVTREQLLGTLPTQFFFPMINSSNISNKLCFMMLPMCDLYNLTLIATSKLPLCPFRTDGSSAIFIMR